MSASAQDFELWTGEDRTLVYTITNRNTGASVNAGDFTRIEWSLSDEQTSGSLIAYNTDNVITATGASVSVAISASDTSGCNLDGTYFTALSACDGDGFKSLLAWGWATINKGDL